MDKKLLGLINLQLDASSLAQQALFARDIPVQREHDKVMSSVQTVYGPINSLPADAVGGDLLMTVKGFTLQNILDYTPSTWAEWTKDTGVTADISGVEFTSDHITHKKIDIATNAKPSTKYGILYTVISSTLTSSDFIIPDDYYFIGTVLPRTVGNQKVVVTSKASIPVNRFRVYLTAFAPAGEKIKINNIRIFELPAGSEIETDFTGMTADQLAAKYNFVVGGMRDAQSVCVRSIGKNLFNKNKVNYNYYVKLADGTLVSANTFNATDYILIKPSTNYVANVIATGGNAGLAFYDQHKNFISSVDTYTFTTPANACYLRASLRKTTISVDAYQLELGTTATAYEPYVETSALTPVVLRCVGAVADTFAPETGTLTKNISDWIILAGSLGWDFHADHEGHKRVRYSFSAPNHMPCVIKYNNLMLAVSLGTWLSGDLAEIYNNMLMITISDSDSGWLEAMTPTNGEIQSYFYGWKMCASDGGQYVSGTKYWKKITDGTGITSTRPTASYTGYTPYKMLYQLASPVVSRFPPQSLQAYPNGTLIAEPVIRGIAKPSRATGKITITDAAYPASSIVKVERVDVLSNGLMQYVDVTTSCTLTDSGTTITITGYNPDKQYVYECLPVSWYTLYPPIEYQYPRADHAKYDTASHDYGGAAADWTLTEAESQALLLSCTNAGGTANIIAPDKKGLVYAVKNGSGQNITIKKSGGTGVTVATAKTAFVMHDGTDYIRLTVDN